jgi:L-ribulose-5-phosphate 3-epimerase
MAKIGIMQGRLVPPAENRIQCFPRDTWEHEFALAAKANLSCIEWIYDQYGADVNPLATDDGIKKIKSLSMDYDVPVRSLCADYFMDKPLVRAVKLEVEDRLLSLEWLMHRCELAGMNRIVLPFVDASRIETQSEFDSVCLILERVLRTAENTNVEIHLETSLTPDRFAELLSKFPHPLLKVNYDSGNSSSLGYHPCQEFASYGTRVGSVHIKDRILGGSTLPLGLGSADFQELSECLEKVDYKGDFILQVARGVTGDEVAWAEQNRQFILNTFTFIEYR